MIWVASFGVTVAMALILSRALLIPTLYDLFLAVNLVATVTVLLLAMLGS